MSEQDTGTSDAAVDQTKHRGGIKDLASRLYQGDAGVDVVGKRKIFYGVAVAIVLIAIVTILVRPFNLGIEFRGGNSFTIPASVGTLNAVQDAITKTGAEVASAQTLGGNKPSYIVKTAELSDDPGTASKKASEIKEALATQFKVPIGDISESAVSGAWVRRSPGRR